MRANHVRDLISAGGTAVNAWVSIDSPYSVEMLSHQGFDSITIDAQHGMFGRDATVRLLQAITAGAGQGIAPTPLVRPSKMDAAEIGWLLDAGAYGVIAPQIDTPELAKTLVDACFYPEGPDFGKRSFGPSRGLLHGGSDYVAHSRETIMPWAMIESRSALSHLEAILQTEGLYGIYVGPNDLALELGYAPGGLVQGEVLERAMQIKDRAHEHGLAAGIFCANGDEAAAFAAAGFDLVTPGNDVSMLRAAASERIGAVRAVGGAAVESQKEQGGY